MTDHDHDHHDHSELSETELRVRALESILTVLALRDGVIPPTLNYTTPDPEIDLDVVAGEPRYGEYQYAINNSFGFGGHNVALAFGAILVLQSPSLRDRTVCKLNSTGLKIFTAQDGLATAEKSVLVAADSQLSTLQDPTSEISAASTA